MTDRKPYIALKNIHKYFGPVIALSDVSFDVYPGEVHCLLGDNGAGKSTFIKTMSGVYTPSKGSIEIEGKKVIFKSSRDGISYSIATVYQDLSMIPLMSVVRNFWMGREPVKKFGPINFLDMKKAEEITRQAMERMGIYLRETSQAFGTLSGGERQIVAIARAVHFGAKILILDEPTSALGVRQTSNVLSIINKVRNNNIGVVFITHNVRHAIAVGDRFTVLNRGKTYGTAKRDNVDYDSLQEMMAGGSALADLDFAQKNVV